MDEVEIDQIHAFKRSLEFPSEEEDLDSDSCVFTTNRGNKLKRGARFVSSRSIAVPEPNMGLTIVDYNGHKRAVMRRLRGPEDEASDSDDVDNDSINDIDLDALLKPIADPADIPKHPAMSRTFESSYLADMAAETLDVIVDEKAHATKISNLLSAFLGDDPDSLSLKNLGVQPYNGNAEQDIDNFFAPPETKCDKNYGVSAEAAEEARQLLQIAHQRMEEFVQCMTTIRMGFTHANRKRRQVLNWCKELNNQDYVEEEVGPEETAPQTWGALMDHRTQTSATATERSD